MNWNLLKTLSLLILVTTYGCGGSESGGGVAPGFNLPTPTGPFPSVRFAPCPPNVGVNGLRCGVLDTYENYAVRLQDLVLPVISKPSRIIVS